MRTLSSSLALLVLFGCGGAKDAPAEGTAAGDCSDAADNDADGLFDCDDDGCAGSPDCEGSDENAAPSGAAIAIEPAAPADADDLRCVIVTEATDPNGDAVTYTYAWSKNGADAGIATDTVSEALTTGGDTWTCTVTPTDGALSGAPASATVTIAQGNRAPSAPTVSITPAEPTDDDVLTCVIDTESVDPDGDLVSYAYAWSVDGGDAGITSASVNAALTEVGQQWTCGVTASDGELESGAASVSVEVSPSGCSATGVYAGFENGALCPIAHWDMSTTERDGRITDLIGANALIATGSPVAGVAGVIGATYEITSATQYFASELPYPARLADAGAKSISAWAYLVRKGGDGDGISPFASFGGAYADGVAFCACYDNEPGDDEAQLGAGSSTYDLQGVTPWATARWYHIAITYDGVRAELYVDGILEASREQTLMTGTSYDKYLVGAHSLYAASTHLLTAGRVDEVKVYDYALTASQVESLSLLTD